MPPRAKHFPYYFKADYAFVANKSRVDLAGCFLIAKSSGNLSIERVEMQATKFLASPSPAECLKKG